MLTGNWKETEALCSWRKGTGKDEMVCVKIIRILFRKWTIQVVLYIFSKSFSTFQAGIGVSLCQYSMETKDFL